MKMQVFIRELKSVHVEIKQSLLREVDSEEIVGIVDLVYAIWRRLFFNLYTTANLNIILHLRKEYTTFTYMLIQRPSLNNVDALHLLYTEIDFNSWLLFQ